MTRPGSLAWLARFELRLAWRDWRALMTAGGRRRIWPVLIVILLFAAIMHLPAHVMVSDYATTGLDANKSSLIIITTTMLLYGSLLMSQAMESVTRAFYARGDFDLILSSPVSAPRIFSVRIGAIAVTIAAMGMMMASPFIDVLVLNGGPRWLAGYGVAAALGVVASGLSVALTIGLIRLIGARRTRLAAQIVAAIVGAAFVIGMQTLAILYYGTMAKPAFLVSPAIQAILPARDSLFWLPARAILGDPLALVAVLAGALLLLLGIMAMFSARFGEHALAASAVISSPVRRRAKQRAFRARSPAAMMRIKEWTLLRRDPWLASQTLTQLLYLLPPALLLSHNFGDRAGSLTVLVLVLVTVAGQLAGGLGWLAVSGEDAPDFIASAPVQPRAILRAKIEAVMGAIALVFTPLIALFALASPRHAAIAALGVAISAVCCVQIQIWFRAQAKRSMFRRRQISSRLATFAEAFTSFTWAGTAGLVVSGEWNYAAGSAVFALLILLGARAIAPRKAA